MSLHHKRLNPRLWQHARRAAMERDKHRCVKCGKAGAMEVHHVTPLHESAELAYELDNLESICRDCHITLSVFAPRLEWRRHIAKFQE